MSWRRFFRRGRWDEERAREIEAHLAIETDEQLARGLSPAAARAAAVRSLGNPTRAREAIYDMNTLAMLDTLWQDVRYAVRVLRRSPAFAAVALLSLALGIGANTAIFELIDAVRLRTLPVPNAASLVEVVVDTHGKGRTGDFSGDNPRMTYALWDQMRGKLSPTLTDSFAWGATRLDLSTGGLSRPVDGLWVSGNLFSALGVRPEVGRLLQPSDDVPGCGEPVAVLGDGYWREAYGGDPSVVGRVLHVNRVPLTIVGVADAGFFGLEVGRRFDVAVPLCSEPRLKGPNGRLGNRAAWWLSIMGHLPAGGSLESIKSPLAAISPAVFAATLPKYAPPETAAYQAFTLIPLEAGSGVSELRRTYEQPLWVLLAIAGFVLLIACANLASLSLARASARGREIAVRLAIGAARSRIFRQLLVESAVLAVVGAAAGALLAAGLSRMLVALLSTSRVSIFVALAFDWRLLLFTAVVTVGTSLLFGLAPAIRMTRENPADAMRSGGRSATESREGLGLRRGLVMAQVGLSLVLVVSALFFGRTLTNLAHANPGFDINGVLNVDYDFSGSSFSGARLTTLASDLLDRVRATPGVEAADFVAVTPLSGSSSNNVVIIDGERRQPFPFVNVVGPEFFRLIRMPILAGRGFSATDTPASPVVAVVNEAFGRAFFHDARPIGRVFKFDDPMGTRAQDMQIVGVVPDSKYADLRDGIAPIAYFSTTQQTATDPQMTLLVRAAGGAPTDALTRAALDLDPTALVTVQSVADIVSTSLVRERLMAVLSGGFGILGGVLAAVGLYGLLSYLVARRRVEIGIRMALGAGRGVIVASLVRESLVLAGIGIVIGLLGARYAARWASSLLFGLSPNDPWVFLAAGVALILIAAAATLAPARRAASLAPTLALRQD